MASTSPHTALWYVLTTLAGVVASVAVQVLTNDVVWTITVLLLTVAVVRHPPRRWRRAVMSGGRARS